MDAPTPGQRQAQGAPNKLEVPQDDTPDKVQTRREWPWMALILGLAGIVWLAAIGLLVSGGSGIADQVSSPRMTLAVTWAAAAMLTFLPLEIRLGLPGLTWQGVGGWTLLGYTLAFVPPPTGWLLDLPDLPVYLILFLALFYAISAAALPLTYAIGRTIYARRMHQFDVRRARREAYELGGLAVALLFLAGLHVLSWLTALLLVAVFALVETLLLSQVAPDG